MSHSLIYIRESVPIGQRRRVPAQTGEGLSLRPLRPGDFKKLLSDLDDSIEKETSRQPAEKLDVVGASSDVGPRSLRVSAQKAKEQLMRLLERHTQMSSTSHDLNNNNNSSSSSSSSSSKSIHDVDSDAVDREYKPDGFRVTPKRLEATQQKYECAFDMIRILVLKPGQSSEPLACEFETRYIKHSEDGLEVLDENPSGCSPGYEALSYVWGDLKDKVNIHVNGQLTQVTFNLACALKQLRKVTEPRRLWVDALCINQLDPVEKSIQVMRMSQIYEEALNVLVWLGPGSAVTDKALDILLSLGAVENEMEVDGMHNSSYGGERLILKPSDPSKLRDIASLSSTELQIVAHLFLGCSWWSRMWIVQEIAHARQAFLICGSRAIDWDILSNMFQLNDSVNRDFGKFCSLLTKPYLLNQQRFESQAKHTLGPMKRDGSTLRSLVHRYCGLACSDPRDRIYALVGLHSCPRTGINVDYSKSVREVFVEATKAMIYDHNNKLSRNFPSLNVACASYRTERRLYSLPSWVPDWSVKPRYWLFDLSEYNHQRYHASGDRKFLRDLEFEENDVMLCTGIDWDNIAALGPTYDNGDKDEDGALRNLSQHLRLQNFLRTWKEISAAVTRYPTGEESTFAFSLTMLATHEYFEGTMASADRMKWHELFDEWMARDHASLWRRILLSSQWRLEELKKLALVMGCWTFCVTERGYFGLVPRTTVISDRVAIWYGANAPVVIRKVTDSDPSSHYLVGPAYVHGIMQGEVLDQDLPTTKFRIV